MVAEMQMLKLRLDHTAREPALSFSNTRRLSFPLDSIVIPWADFGMFAAKQKPVKSKT